MSVDKLVDSTQLDSDLTSVANAIRGKTGGSNVLAFPADFVSAINGIPTGGGATLTETNIPVSNNAISFGQSIDYLLKIDIANQELCLAKMDVLIDELNTEITLQCGWTYDDVAYFFGSDEYGTPFVADVYDIGGNLLEVASIQDFVGNSYLLLTVINFKWYTLE